MAKSKEQLQQELEVISEKTREAYDALNGTGGLDSKGLYRLLSIAEKDAVKESNFERVKVQARKDIKTLTAKIKAAEVTYKKFQDQKNALNKELKTLEKVETEKKTKAATAKGAGNVYDKALEELKKAELGIEGYKGQERYIEAYRKAEAAFKTAVDSGVTPKNALPPAQIEIPVIEAEAGKVGADGKPVKEPTPTEFIALVTDPKNKQLLIDVQKDLQKNFGYTGPVDGSPSALFLPSLQRAYDARANLPEAWRGSDFRSFLTTPGAGVTSGGAGGAGGPAAPDAFATISSQSQAKSAINQIFQNELGRDATPAEIKNLYPQLIKAQAANPTKQKIVKGVRQTITGLDVGQWITDKARSLEEFKTKKAEKAGGIREDIIESLGDNGLFIDPKQVDGWVKQIENGGSLDAVKRTIRNIASVGQPESIKKMIAEGTDLATIYSPYRSTMAGVLEVPIESIKLNDPTLRQAIGPDKEMSTYDFERTLRQDDRWQYTDQARSEAATIATRVLQDFGFMG
jgi:hypothetical protein